MGVQQARSPLCYDDGGPQPNLEERKPFMKHPALSAALAMILGIVAGCASTPQPGQMDCRALTAGSIGPSIGLRAGPPLLGVGPEFTFGGEYWDPEVQTLVAGYRGPVSVVMLGSSQTRSTASDSTSLIGGFVCLTTENGVYSMTWTGVRESRRS